MATVVIMPKQGQSVESCILTEFKKKKGDKVAVGDILFAYETDKASFEEESKCEGTVLEIFFNEGDEIPVLTNVMVIGNEGESVEEFRPSGNGASSGAQTPIVSSHENATESTPSQSQSADVRVATAPVSNASSNISPRAKALAEKLRVNLSYVVGSGPEGRIIERDVEAAFANSGKMTPLAQKMAADNGTVAPQWGSGLGGDSKSSDLQAAVAGAAAIGDDFEIKPLSNIRKLIAKSMYASLQSSAQLTHHLSADARRMQALRKKAKKALESGAIDTNITLNDFVCYAVIKALKQFPNVNSHFLGNYSMKLFNKVHLGLAVDTERGLMVPTVKNADDMSIVELSKSLKGVADACKKGSIDPDLLSSEAASFTVSNLGNYGVEIFTPIINVPQSAILGVNTIVPRPKDLGGGVYAFVPHIGLSLTYDHRSIDGGEATRFLKQIAIEIENLDIDF